MSGERRTPCEQCGGTGRVTAPMEPCPNCQSKVPFGGTLQIDSLRRSLEELGYALLAPEQVAQVREVCQFAMRFGHMGSWQLDNQDRVRAAQEAAWALEDSTAGGAE